ncbi:hypothetical protein BGX34_011994 [Mortierella sp. NVP85]|nr:hypothetical protein BGX34_011994 [Mortierella sp. NVP85]
MRFTLEDIKHMKDGARIYHVHHAIVTENRDRKNWSGAYELFRNYLVVFVNAYQKAQAAAKTPGALRTIVSQKDSVSLRELQVHQRSAQPSKLQFSENDIRNMQWSIANLVRYAPTPEESRVVYMFYLKCDPPLRNDETINHCLVSLIYVYAQMRDREVQKQGLDFVEIALERGIGLPAYKAVGDTAPATAGWDANGSLLGKVSGPILRLHGLQISADGRKLEQRPGYRSNWSLQRPPPRNYQPPARYPHPQYNRNPSSQWNQGAHQNPMPQHRSQFPVRPGPSHQQPQFKQFKQSQEQTDTNRTQRGPETSNGPSSPPPPQPQQQQRSQAPQTRPAPNQMDMNKDNTLAQGPDEVEKTSKDPVASSGVGGYEEDQYNYYSTSRPSFAGADRGGGGNKFGDNSDADRHSHGSRNGHRTISFIPASNITQSSSKPSLDADVAVEGSGSSNLDKKSNDPAAASSGEDASAELTDRVERLQLGSPSQD